MKLTNEGIKNKEEWVSKNYRLPKYDRDSMIEKTKETPVWVHFGAGNIFRAFHANAAQKMLDEGFSDRGITVVEGFDYEIVEKMYRPHDDLSILVTLKADGDVEKVVVGGIAESCILDSENDTEYGRLKEIFSKDSLQLATFTITEKGYSLRDAKGNVPEQIQRDFENGPAKPESYIGKVTSLLYTRYLSGKKKIEVPIVRRPGNGRFLTVKGAQENNLKDIDVRIPLGEFVCVTGVSGSGKSSLINDILYKSLAQSLYRAKERPGKCRGIEGLENIDKVINIDQSPIGRTPRSNPATYTGVFTNIRQLFAQTNDAKMRGFDQGRFSFNVKGGRCEACGGDGIIKIEMNFLPDVYIPCEVCGGRRYNRETLEVRYKGKNIAEVLDMTVEEALPFFEHVPAIRQKIKMLHDVGLDYIKQHAAVRRRGAAHKACVGALQTQYRQNAVHTG